MLLLTNHLYKVVTMQWIFLAFITLICSFSAYSACVNPQKAQEIATISNSKLTENSGMDFSRIHKNVFWTLNDANNTSEIFAISTAGENLGAYEIEGVKNVDWEDIAVAPCIDDSSANCIFIADIGNNKGKRNEFYIHVVEEPLKLNDRSLTVKETITFHKNGGFNFESFSINERTKEFYLISKAGKKDEIKNTSFVFGLTEGASELKTLATISFDDFPEELSKEDMTVTSGDFHTPSQTLLIGTYGKAYEISLKDIKSFNSKARTIEIPQMEQAEAITYQSTPEGLSILTSSEGTDQPLYKISCQ
ncbi:MAG TPA: hypothetical protein VNJ08_06260 [Bacteriovoracaceae bacterium]|nr:hypothetical protein [Bacteriovoracaceae bacterium]